MKTVGANENRQNDIDSGAIKGGVRGILTRSILDHCWNLTDDYVNPHGATEPHGPDLWNDLDLHGPIDDLHRETKSTLVSSTSQNSSTLLRMWNNPHLAYESTWILLLWMSGIQRSVSRSRLSYLGEERARVLSSTPLKQI